MKLLSCYIENYGKISGETFVFNDGVTEFCKENGFGKTTLASFIKAMFYGLPSSRVNAKDFDDRQHFYPFNGGRFGGNLTFEMRGKTYKIERFFGKKSEKDDELKVYENGRETFTLGTEIGRVVFGLDEDSFARTVFIGAEEQEVTATGGINAKLNRFVDGTDGERDFERAVDALDKAKKRLKATRGNNDLSTKQKEKIYRLNADIENLERIGETLDGLYKERERLSENVRGLEEREKKAHGENLLLQKWETYDEYARAAKEEQERERALKTAYPYGVPTKAETDGVFKRLERSVAAKSRMESQAFSAEKAARLKTLEEVFANGVPTGETLERLQADVNEIHALSVEIDHVKGAGVTAREEELARTFTGRVPTAERLNAAREDRDAYKRAEAELQAYSTAALTRGDKGKKSKLPVALAAVSVVALALGAVLAFLIVAAGIALLAVGGVGLLIAGFLYLKGQTGNGGGKNAENVARLQAEIQQRQDAVREFLVPYGYYSANGVVYDLARFESDLQEYQSGLTARENTAALLEGKAAKRNARIAEVKRVFTAYRLTGERWQENITALTTAAKEYQSLQKEAAFAAQNADGLARELEENAAAILAVLQKYGMQKEGDLTAQFKRLERAREELERLQTSVKTATERAESYRAANGLIERVTGEKTDTEALSRAISETRGALALCDRRITEAERQIEALPDKYNERTQAEETMEEYRRKYRLYQDALACLSAAETNLQNRYVAPIKQGFLKYSAAIENALGEKVSMDKDFRLRFERGGEERSDKHLSAGQRSVCALCLRLALVDNMYETEAPFIVMDDPFVALDKEHMQSTAKLINELAKDRQIVYFCCHESRSVTP